MDTMGNKGRIGAKRNGRKLSINTEEINEKNEKKQQLVLGERRRRLCKKRNMAQKKKKYKNKSCENLSYCASLAIIIRPWFLLTESHLALHFQRLARLWCLVSPMEPLLGRFWSSLLFWMSVTVGWLGCWPRIATPCDFELCRFGRTSLVSFVSTATPCFLFLEVRN